jgi:hypothetical protein
MMAAAAYLYQETIRAGEDVDDCLVTMRKIVLATTGKYYATRAISLFTALSVLALTSIVAPASAGIETVFSCRIANVSVCSRFTWDRWRYERVGIIQAAPFKNGSSDEGRLKAGWPQIYK